MKDSMRRIRDLAALGLAQHFPDALSRIYNIATAALEAEAAEEKLVFPVLSDPQTFHEGEA